MRMSWKTAVFGAGAAAVAVGGFVLLSDSNHGQAGALAVSAKPLPVPVVAVDQRTVPVYLDFVGTTEAIRSVLLQAKIIGYLAAQSVNDGSDVQKDELLYQIDPRDYQAALAQATAPRPLRMERRVLFIAWLL